MRKSVKLVSLLLCLTLFFSFPFSASASDYSLEPDYLNTTVTGNGYINACDSSTCKFDGSSITWSNSANLVQTSQITSCSFGFDIVGDFSPDDVITINYSNTLGGFIFNSASGFVRENGQNTSSILLNSSSGTFTYTVLDNTDNLFFYISSSDITKSPTSTSPSTRFKVTFSVETAETGLLKTIIEYIKGIFSDLQDLPNKIGDFFSNLITNLQNLFNNVGEWFSQLGDKIGDFFTNLGDNISGFFEKLWNRIYWGNENGEAEYQPPVFGSSLDDVLDTLDGYITQLDDTNDQIESATDTSVAYVEQGTTVINSVFGVFPSIVTALVIFGVVFIFCRKVVGR